MVRISAIPVVNFGMVSTLAIFNTITELLRPYKPAIQDFRKMPSKNQKSIILFAFSIIGITSIALLAVPFSSLFRGNLLLARCL